MFIYKMGTWTVEIYVTSLLYKLFGAYLSVGKNLTVSGGIGDVADFILYWPCFLSVVWDYRM